MSARYPATNCDFVLIVSVEVMTSSSQQHHWYSRSSYMLLKHFSGSNVMVSFLSAEEFTLVHKDIAHLYSMHLATIRTEYE